MSQYMLVDDGVERALGEAEAHRLCEQYKIYRCDECTNDANEGLDPDDDEELVVFHNYEG